MSKTDAVLCHDIILRYEKGESSVALSRALGLSTATVLNVLKRAGVAPSAVSRGRPRQGQKLFRKDIEAIIEGYATGASTNELASKHGVTASAILYILKSRDITRRNRGAAFKDIDGATVNRMAELWHQGMSQTKIGKTLGLSQTNVCRLFKVHGIKGHKRKAEREQHGNWKGGKSASDGYALILLSEDDPFRAMANSGGYVLEHRLVMARKLGRCLLPSETVHHVDGNKMNNAPENLQLRIGRHGKGVAYECACCGSRDLRPAMLG